MARNVHQIYGPVIDESPRTACVIGWTSSADNEGGTGQAYRMARALDIPIIELREPLDAQTDAFTALAPLGTTVRKALVIARDMADRTQHAA